MIETRPGRLRSVRQSAQVATYDLDCTTADGVWSREFSDIAGLPGDGELLSVEQFEALIHPDDRHRFLEKLENSLCPAGIGRFRDECRIVRAGDGAVRWIKIEGRTFFTGEDRARRPLAATGIILDITSTRAYQQALVESREELDQLTEAALDAIISIDADQRVIRFNAAAVRMFGCPASEAMGGQLERFMPERYRAGHAEKVRRFAEDETPSHALNEPRRFTGLRQNGDEFPFEATVTKVEVGGRVRMSTFMRDITERVRVEEALRRSKEDLELAVRGADVGIWYWDTNTGEVEWSEQQYRLFGVPIGEPMTFDRFLAGIHPDDRERLLVAVGRALETGEEYQFEGRVIVSDGSIRWVANRGRRYLEGRNGERNVMRGVSLDITDRKLAEQALRQSEAQLSAIFEHAPVGMAHIALPEPRFIRVNEASCRIVGYAQEELLGRSPLEFSHPEDIQIGQKSYARLVAGEIPSFTVEKRYLKKDGGVVWGRTTISAVCDETGGPRFAVGLLEDVTEAKMADEARRDAERRLELAVSIAEVGTWEWNLVSGDVELSPLSKKLLGYEGELPADFGEDWTARLHPEDREPITVYVARYVEHPEPEFRIEYRLRNHDGGYRWLVSRAVPVLDKHGRLVKMIGTQVDVTSRKLSEQRIREAALHDALTGLPNRALVFEYGSLLLAAAKRNHSQGAVLFIDLDRFKPINDLYGHEVGDRVLEEVAQRLTDCTREADLVGRMGGDEFIIVLPHLEDGRHRAIAVAQHVLDAINRPFLIGEFELSLSPSIGISFYPTDGSDVSALIHAADLAMYQAKQSGRANYQLYTPDLDRCAEEAHSLEARLRAALRNDGLALHYQPVVDIKNGKSVGAEALVRMKGNDDELIGPTHFIPIAESAGLIAELGEWVATEACRQHGAWLEEGLRVQIAINVSPLQFRQRGFAETLHGIIDRSHIDPSCLQLEVTESTIMESVDAAIEILHQLKALGVRVALDDFGTGYSSLSRLSSLPLDKLKVDQSFVQHIEQDKASQAVTEAIIALGCALKLDVVGEGIESEQALRYLQQHGCNQAQGFWFSEPLPAPEFARWCREQRIH